MTEKYCIHCFIHHDRMTEIVNPFKSRTLRRVALFLSIVGNIDAKIEVSLKFRKHSYETYCSIRYVWIGSTKIDTNIWAKAHLVTDPCPAGWKSEVIE